MEKKRVLKLKVKTALFFATLSGYVMVYGKVAKMEKTISIDNVIRALVQQRGIAINTR